MTPIARRLARTAGFLFLTTCSDGATSGPPPPPLTDVLVIDTAAAMKANRAAEPNGFAGPREQACGPDTTRMFLGELATHDPTTAKVPLHWAPVVPGPSRDAATVKQPEPLLSGTVRDVSHSTDDVPFDHVFGYDETFEIAVDAAFDELVYPGQSAGRLHTEIDSGLLPETAFGWNVTDGDRVVVRGAWILDCGHPPYSAEIHPPTFVAFARAADPTTTVALAFVNPLRETQLYNPDLSLVDDFQNDSRYEDADSKPFPYHLLDELLQVKGGQRMRLDAHDLLEPTRLPPLTWYVCAPRARPAGATLDYSYRFAARTGVTVDATPLADDGCVRFTANMGDAYRPFIPVRHDVAWSWDEISRQASDGAGMPVDVRQKIIDALGGSNYAALALDNPPLIDRYAPLAPRADAALDAPTAIATSADDQPYPFYGRARVAWRVPR